MFYFFPVSLYSQKADAELHSFLVFVQYMPNVIHKRDAT